MNSQELKTFLEKFHSDKIAGFLTNSSGFIIEANQAAANFFSSDIPKLKNKSLRSFIADRKNSQVRFDSMRERANVIDSSESKEILIRTQPVEGKRIMLRTALTCEVIGRGNKIVLMLWKFIHSESKSADKDQSTTI